MGMDQGQLLERSQFANQFEHPGQGSPARANPFHGKLPAVHLEQRLDPQYRSQAGLEAAQASAATQKFDSIQRRKAVGTGGLVLEEGHNFVHGAPLRRSPGGRHHLQPRSQRQIARIEYGHR